MNEFRLALRSGWVRVWLGAGAVTFALGLLLSWAAERRFSALLDQMDARQLDEAAAVLDGLVHHQGRVLSSTIGVISEDTRVRAMVLTPTFDPSTVLDLLNDLKATSGASVAAILDSSGTVRAVVGAPEMAELNLGSSSLVRSALDKPAAQVWAFASKVGVLAATPVRLDGQVRALFMLGYEMTDAELEDIRQDLGASGAIFVGDGIAASARKDPDTERALRAAAEVPPGSYRIVDNTFLASSSRLSDSAVAARAAWLIPLQRHSAGLTLTRALFWLPSALMAMMLAFMFFLVTGQTRAARPLGTGALVKPGDRQGVRRYEIEPD